MNYIYITDGSFEGLLTSIHTKYYSKDNVTDVLHKKPAQMDFLVAYKVIKTDNNKAYNVYNAISRKISNRASYEITMAWLSEIPKCGKMILDYVKLGFKVGKQIDCMFTHQAVLPVLKASQKVLKEKHLMLGLCRFSKTRKNYYLCRISPDHNILPLISPHFASRMPNQRWIIADTSRNIASVYDCEKWYIISSKLSEKVPYASDEMLCRDLWKKYFYSIAIAGRRNPKLQRNMMPVRYWKNLTELN